MSVNLHFQQCTFVQQNNQTVLSVEVREGCRLNIVDKGDLINYETQSSFKIEPSKGIIGLDGDSFKFYQTVNGLPKYLTFIKDKKEVSAVLQDATRNYKVIQAFKICRYTLDEHRHDDYYIAANIDGDNYLLWFDGNKITISRNLGNKPPAWKLQPS